MKRVVLSCTESSCVQERFDRLKRQQRAALVIGNPKHARLYHMIKHERRVGQKMALQTALTRLQAVSELWVGRGDSQRLTKEALMEMGKALVGCNVMLGMLQPQGDAIKYLFATPGSTVVGKVLHRGEGVSFRAVDTGEHVCCMGQPSPFNTPTDSRPKLLSGSRRAGLDLPLLVVPLAAQGARVGVLAVDKFSTHNEDAGWRGSEPRRDEVAQRVAAFSDVRGNAMRKFRLWRHPEARSDGAKEVEPPFYDFSSTAMVAGRIVDVVFHPRWGPSYTVKWEDGLVENEIGQKVLEDMLAVTRDRLGHGSFVDAGTIEVLRAMGGTLGQALDKVRKENRLKALRALTKAFDTTVDDVHQKGLEAVVENVLMNRVAEVWEVRELSELAHDVEAIVRINPKGELEKKRCRRALEEVSKPGRRLFFERLFRFRGDPVAFTMPEVPEIVVAPFRDDGPVTKKPPSRVLKVHIVECQKIAIAKKGVFGVGRTDPFCIALYNSAEIFRSCVKNNTCYPKWDESEGLFYVRIPDEPWDMELIIQLWDMVKGKEGQFLGQVVLQMEQMLFPSRGVDDYELQTRPQHATADGTVVQGKMLLALKGVDKRDRRRSRASVDSSGPTAMHSLTTASSLYSKGASILQLRINGARNLGAVGLMGKANPVVVVKWNDNEMGRTTVLTMASDPVWDQDFEIVMPEDTMSSDLCLEVWNMGTLGLGPFLGQAVVNGGRLQVPSPGQVAFDLLPKPLRDDAFNRSVKGQIMISFTVKYIAPKEARPSVDEGSLGSVESTETSTVTVPPILKLEVIEAHGLAKADLFGKSDPFCIIKWAGNEVGRTKVLPKTLDPVWHENFDVPLIGDPFASELCVEVWDMDTGGFGDFLGQVVLRTDDLYADGGEQREYNLLCKPGTDAGSQKLVKGKLTLRFTVVAAGAALTVSTNAPSSLTTGGLGSTSRLGTTTHPIVRVQVHKAVGLARADLFGLSDPFCILKWAGNEVGRTVVVKRSLNPVWENQAFEVNMEGKLEENALTIEVWDQDPVGGDFLGQMTLRAKHLLRADSGVVAYKLGRSKELDPKKQALVKGTLFISHTILSQGNYVLSPKGVGTQTETSMLAFVQLTVQVQELTGLSKLNLWGGKCDAFVVVRWEGNEVGRTAVIEQCTDAKWEDEVFVIETDGPDVKGALLVEAFDMKRTGASLLGYVTLQDDEITTDAGTSVTRELQRKGFQSPLSPRKRPRLTFTCGVTEVKEGAPSRPGSPKMARVGSAGGLQPSKSQRVLKIDVHRATGLSRVEFFSKPSPYCIVKVNGKEVGKTKVVKRSVDPRFEDEQFRAVLGEKPPELCVELWSSTSKGPPGIFLGQVHLKGESLGKLHRQVAYTLQDPYAHRNLRGNLFLSFEVVEEEVSPEAQVDASSVPKLALVLHRASRLIKPDVFTWPHVYCLVRWGGQEMARTPPLPKPSTDPVFPDGFAAFEVPLTGQLESQSVEVELWHAGSSGAHTFLGQVSWRGDQVAEGAAEAEYALAAKPGFDSKRAIKGGIVVTYSVRGNVIKPALTISVQSGAPGAQVASPLATDSRLKLTIHSVSGLSEPQADPKPDLWCVVKLRGLEVGRAKAATWGADAIWNDDTVDVTIPKGAVPAETEVSVELLRITPAGSDVLGRLVLTAAQVLSRELQARVVHTMPPQPSIPTTGPLKLCLSYQASDKKARPGSPKSRKSPKNASSEPATAAGLPPTAPEEVPAAEADAGSAAEGSVHGSLDAEESSQESSQALPGRRRSTYVAPVPQVMEKLGTLRLKILEARGLGKANVSDASDGDGQSDPFCVVLWDDKELARTEVIEKTLDPVWEHAHFDLALVGDPDVSLLCVEVWDMEESGKGEFLGQVMLKAEVMMGPSNGEVSYELICKPGMDKKAQKLVQGSLLLCWDFDAAEDTSEAAGDAAAAEGQSVGDSAVSSLSEAQATKLSDALPMGKIDLKAFKERRLMHALVATRAPSYTWPADVAFCGRVAPELEVAIRCVRARYYRVREREQCINELKKLCNHWEKVSFKRLVVTARYILERCLPSTDAYIGFLQKGGRVISYVESTRHSKMTGQRLRAGEGMAFFSIYDMKPQVLHEEDTAVPPRPARMQAGDRVLIRYGRTNFPGKVLKWATRETYDVLYDSGEKEAGVPSARLTWVPPVKPLPYKFATSGKLGWPFVCVPVRHGSIGLGEKQSREVCKPRHSVKCVPVLCAGVIGVDGFENMEKGREDEKHPEEGVVNFLCTIGSLIGTAIDMQRKTKAMRLLTGVTKDPRAKASDVFNCVLDVIFDNLIFCRKVELWEEYPDKPHSMRPLQQRGDILIEMDKKLARRNYVPTDAADVLKTVGRKEEDNDIYCMAYKPFPSILIGRCKAFELRSLGDMDEETVNKLDFLVIYRQPGIHWQEDCNFVAEVCQTMELALMCIHGREFRGRARNRLVDKLVKLCEEWTDLETRRLIVKVVDGLAKCFLGSDLYFGMLLPGGELVEFIQATRRSAMAGQRLLRGTGVGFDAIDERRQVVVKRFADPDAMRLRVYGESLMKCLPFVCTPVKRGERTVRGIINVDNIGKNDDDEHPEPAELELLDRVCTALGTTIDKKAKEKAMIELVKNANAPGVTVLEVYQMTVKALKGNIPLARQVERWCLPLAEKVAGLDAASALGGGGPKKVVVDIHSAKGLARADLFGKSDPFCVLKWNAKEIGRTEVSYKTLDPVWKDEHFEFMASGDAVTSNLVIEVWDMDTTGVGDFLGQVMLRGTDLPGACGRHTEFDLKCKPGQDPKTQSLVQGHLCISLAMEELVVTADGPDPKLAWEAPVPVLMLQVHRAEGLVKADLFGKSDPFCIIRWGGKEAARTKVIQKTLDPVWDSERFDVPMDPDAPDQELSVEVWDMDLGGMGDFLGQVTLTKEQLQTPVTKAQAPFALQVRKSSPSDKVTGTLYFRYRIRDEALGEADVLEDEEPVEDNNPKIILDILSASGLAKADFFGKSDPFCTISWGPTKLGKTKVIQKSLDPVWNERFEFSLPGDLAANSLLIEVQDMNTFGTGAFLGQIELTDEHLKSTPFVGGGGSSYSLEVKPGKDPKTQKLVQGSLKIKYDFMEDPTKKPPVAAMLQARVVRVRGIVKAKISKSLSLSFRMKYQGEEVARTASVEPGTDLAFGPPVDAGADLASDPFCLAATSPGGREALAHALTLELWEITKTNEERCLGVLVMSEAELRAADGKKIDLHLLPPGTAGSAPSTKGKKPTPVATVTMMCRVEDLPEEDPDEITDEELSKLKLQVLRAAGLAKADFFGKSDPFCIVKWKGQEVGRTKVIQKTLDPVWENENFDIEMAADLGSSELTLEVWDMDQVGVGDFLGQVTLTRKQLKVFSEGEVGFDLKPKPDMEASAAKLVKGTLYVSYSKIKGRGRQAVEKFDSVLKLQILEAHGLAKADLFGKSDPFCIVKWNGNEAGRTKVIQKTLDPIWDNELFDVGLTGELAQGQLEIEVWDMDASGMGDFLGQIVLKGSELDVPTDGPAEYDLIAKEGESARLVKGYLLITFKRVGLDGRPLTAGLEENPFDALVLNVLVKGCVNLTEAAMLSQNFASYCAVKWNSKEVGQTPAVTCQGNPEWSSGNFFTFKVPTDRNKMRLQFEVWKQGVVGGNQLIGTVKLRGDIVIHAPVGPKRYRISRADDQSKAFPKLESYLILEIVPDCKLWFDCAKLLNQVPSLILRVHDARGLAKADLFGMSDPFCIVKWGGKEVGRTKVIDETLNPDWDDEEFELPLPDDPTSTDLIVEVWDMDAVGIGDFLGQVVLGCGALIRLPPDRIEYELKEKNAAADEEAAEQGKGGKPKKKKKETFVQGVLGLSVRQKEVARNSQLKYETRPYAKALSGRIQTHDVGLVPIDLYTLFQSSSNSPTSCILYEDSEMVVASFRDLRVKIGDTFIGPPEGCYRYSVVATGPAGFSTFEDAIFSKALIKETEASIRRLRGQEQRAAARDRALADIERVCQDFRKYELDGFYRALFAALEVPLLGADIYLGLLQGGGISMKYVFATSESEMVGKVLARGNGISFKCIGAG
jgi:Ca2+-dependent lipid-binding protein